ncbi:alkaline phosphatase family protein [Halorubrum sp. SD683]|uniref:alkaline phosphatase family protein n=1 Tax=Halorubrum sp. SD683 TaxID=1855873 RepID=UPI000A2E98F8|nr:alkaline phosphatase family protein [Halorubrum sp. SD683]OTF01689.1 phosphodiesterase [Halorubrum sp. SD683]
MRTLLVGLDGVCREVLDPLFDADRLPTLSSLFDRGVVGPLESQIPPWTPSAWPSLYTGVNPGKHGAFDFLAFDGYDWGLVNRSHVREHALWELLDRHGRTSVVVNVPVTGPPRSFDGALVPGYVSPEEPTCHPEGLFDRLREELGEYRVYAPEGIDGDEQIEWYERLTRSRGEAFRLLADEHDPEFGFLQFQQTDTVFHERPEDDEAVRAVFEAVDEQIAETLDACDPDRVIVASDHGIGPYDGAEFRVNEYLAEQEYLRTTTGEGGMPSWTAIKDSETATPSASERLVALASSLGLSSQRLGSVLERLGLKEFVLRHVSTDTVRAGTERVDFPDSAAYMRSRTELGVRINKAGRDPDGVVAPAEYPSVRDDLITALEAARTPEGDPVFADVAPAEEYFEGPYVDEAVDIVTVPAGFDRLLSASLRGEPFGDPPAEWNHKPTGIVALAGEGVDTAAGLDGAHLFDVAPTVLSSLGVSPSTRMDGETLPPVEAEPTDAYPPFDTAPNSTDDEDAVTRRLSQLGYIDDDEY